MSTQSSGTEWVSGWTVDDPAQIDYVFAPKDGGTWESWGVDFEVRDLGLSAERNVDAEDAGRNREHVVQIVMHRQRQIAAAATAIEERQFAAECDFFVAQLRAQQGLVPVEFGHVVAQAFERPEDPLPVVRLGAFRGQLGLADSGARGSKAFGRALEHGPAFRPGVVPVRAAA